MDTKTIIYTIIGIGIIFMLYQSGGEAKEIADNTQLMDCYHNGQLISGKMCDAVIQADFNNSQTFIDNQKAYMKARAALEDQYRQGLDNGFDKMSEAEKQAQINYYLNQ